jgi:hypothetical protein
MPDTHDPHKKGVKPADAPRQPTPDEILRARPVEGETDYESLIREHMARYPKIRAALAK